MSRLTLRVDRPWGAGQICGYPAVYVDVLREHVENLGLPRGTETSLDKKLQAALDALLRGNEVTARSHLEAFVNAVEAQRGKKITDAEADALIAEAESVISTLPVVDLTP